MKDITMHAHLNTSDNPYAQAVRDLSLAGLITPAEEHDLLAHRPFDEEHA